MSEVLTVPTAFGDISEMAQGLVDRVDEQQIILYGPNAYEEGSELGFALLLVDGTTALEGRGVVATSVDGGEERDPSTRFDIILQELKFDGVAEVVFERMVMARGSIGDEPPAEVAEAPLSLEESQPLEEPEAYAAPEEPTAEAPAPEAQDASDFGGFDDESTVVAGIEHAEMIAATMSVSAAEPLEEPEPPVAEAAPEEEPAVAASEPPPPAEEPEPALSMRRYSEDALTEPPPDEPTAAPAQSRRFSEPSPAPAATQSHPARSFAPATRETDSLRPAAADLPIRPGAPAPEPPAPPAGFAIDNSVIGIVRPHTVWSPVAPPPPAPRPSTGLFQYGSGPIPIPQRPPRPDLDPSLRVDRAPAPIREGEVPTHSDAPPARASRPPRRVDFDDAMMADAVDLDPVSADE